MTITPEEKKIIDEAKLIAEKANLDLSDGNGEFEKRYLDTQASFTKSRQSELEMAELLVKADPSYVEKISDDKIKSKILQKIWAVDNMEELNVLFPNALKPKKEEDEDELTEVEKLRQEVNLMKYKNKKENTKEALENIALQNKNVVATIDNFEEKMKDELKFISEGLDAKSRIDKAFKLVVGAFGNQADAYSIMQGITIDKGTKSDVDDKELLNAQNEYRKLLGLKTK